MNSFNGCANTRGPVVYSSNSLACLRLPPLFSLAQYPSLMKSGHRKRRSRSRVGRTTTTVDHNEGAFLVAEAYASMICQRNITTFGSIAPTLDTDFPLALRYIQQRTVPCGALVPSNASVDFAVFTKNDDADASQGSTSSQPAVGSSNGANGNANGNGKSGQGERHGRADGGDGESKKEGVEGAEDALFHITRWNPRMHLRRTRGFDTPVLTAVKFTKEYAQQLWPP